MQDTFGIRDGKVIFNGVWYDFDELPENVVFNGNIDLYVKFLDRLPDMSSWTINGYFRCSSNKLSTIKGSPNKITSGFDCSCNNLSSLEFCPKYISGDFDCTWNKLTSLKYCPNNISGYFICYGNKLTSLEHCPKEVGKSF